MPEFSGEISPEGARPRSPERSAGSELPCERGFGQRGAERSGKETAAARPALFAWPARLWDRHRGAPDPRLVSAASLGFPFDEHHPVVVRDHPAGDLDRPLGVTHPRKHLGSFLSRRLLHRLAGGLFLVLGQRKGLGANQDRVDRLVGQV